MTLNKNIVADSGPLIAFGRINNLSIVSELFGTIDIPEAVRKECVKKKMPGALTIEDAIKKGNIKVHFTTSFFSDLNHEWLEILGEGEAHAIALAKKTNSLLLMDEKLGRRIAATLQLKIIGSAGVLLLAKKYQVIQSIKPFILQLKTFGYHLSDELIVEILKRAEEH